MDPRRGNAKCHELLDILTIALLASVCGANNCVDFAEFAEDGEALPREFLSLENGLAIPGTFSRMFRLLDPSAFGQRLSDQRCRPRPRRDAPPTGNPPRRLGSSPIATTCEVNN